MARNSKNPCSLKSFKAAVAALSRDAQLVLYRFEADFDGSNWRRWVFLLSHLRSADDHGRNPLLVLDQLRDDMPEPLGLAGRLGLTASEIMEKFGNLWIEADDLMEWLLDEGRLRLVN